MAVDYKPLNRNQEFTTPQKAALKKVFGLAETAANPSTSATISRKIIHTALSGYFPYTEKKSLTRVFAELRDAIDDDDAARDMTTVVGSTSFASDKRKIIRTMTEAVVALISA